MLDQWFRYVMENFSSLPVAAQVPDLHTYILPLILHYTTILHRV